MKKWIAFLRGINISGKNKIPMKELKFGFEHLGYSDVKTYLNSGNVLFGTDENQSSAIVRQVELMIEERFGLDIPVYVMALECLEDILRNAPDWWGNENKDVYDNLIFIMPPATFPDVFHEIGEPKDGLERIENYNDVVFWSFDAKQYQKTNWWSKTATADIKDHLTIRTANTVKRLVFMCHSEKNTKTKSKGR